MNYELRDCIKGNDGHLYCWDCVIGDWIRMNTERVGVNGLPPDVLRGLVTKLENDKKKVISD